MANLALEAMQFARKVHREQVRKYTGNPYVDHLAEVAGIVSTVLPDMAGGRSDLEYIIAVAWLHDSVEDQDVVPAELHRRFGPIVADGVLRLSDLEIGNRAERKAASRARLAEAPGWIQTIKCADLISNTSSIILHDPKSAETYLREKRELLAVMGNANRQLWEIAMSQSTPDANKENA